MQISQRCLSRAGTAADAESVAVTVAARFFADDAVQRQGQSTSDSPQCCGQRGGFNSRGTGAKGACPGLGPRRMQRASLSLSPRGFLLTTRSNDGDSQQVTVPDAAGSAAASTAGGLVGASAPTFEVAGRCMRGLALAACPELGPRRMQKSSMSPSPRSPRGFLLT